jgi:hypothetical protein
MATRERVFPMLSSNSSLEEEQANCFSHSQEHGKPSFLNLMGKEEKKNILAQSLSSQLII